MRLLRVISLFASAALAVVALTGCATKEMKGTPFYTGEYTIRQGPVEDRVNLWPLLYYRQPALSVLWPFIEKTDEHFAARPLFSLYGLDQTNRIVNVLWPIAQFDRQKGNNRVFPFYWGDDYGAVLPFLYWGDDYFVGFPLYWHFGNPLSAEGGYDGLIPLWSFGSSRGSYSAYVLGPLLHAKEDSREKGWYLGPLAGNYTRKDDSYYRFQLWPFLHQGASPGATRTWSAALPLYYARRGAAGSLFLSLPWSRCATDDGASWWYVPPMFYHSTDERGALSVLPLWAAGSSADKTRSWRTLIPVFYARQSPSNRVFATLLGGMKTGSGRTGWAVVPLLSWGNSGADGHDAWFVGPMIHSRRRGEERSSHALPLYYHSADAEGSKWITPIWAGGSSADGAKTWQALIPLYYRQKDELGRTLATLIGGFRTDKKGRRWLIYPLLSWGGRSRDGGEIWAVAPLAHARWGKQGKANHVVPLWYWNSRSGTFLSLPVAKWNRRAGRTVMIPPALSWLTTGKGRKDLWLVGPLAHASWGPERGAQHVLPLYYRNPRTKTLITPVVAAWSNRSSRTVLIPPLLSWKTSRPDRKDLWLVGPLAHASWGPARGSQHVFPLYYRDPRKDTMLSPLVCSWNSTDRRGWIIPFLLSSYSRSATGREIWGPAGIFRQQWGGEEGRSGHLLPLYAYEEDNYFFSPLFGWKKGDRGFLYPLTPLVGVYRGDNRGGWLFPLVSRKYDKWQDRTTGNFLWGRYRREGKKVSSGIFPLYAYHNTGSLDSTLPPGQRAARVGKDFFCLPICWYKNEVYLHAGSTGAARRVTRTHTKESGVFPLWSYSRTSVDETEKEVRTSVLLSLYDYRHVVEPGKGGEGPEDYTRSRILWRLWHCERLNGDVSVDVIPAITYDRKKDGFKKISFLWRFFRYERGADGAKKLDLCFIPVLRTKSAGGVR